MATEQLSLIPPGGNLNRAKTNEIIDAVNAANKESWVLTTIPLEGAQNGDLIPHSLDTVLVRFIVLEGINGTAKEEWSCRPVTPGSVRLIGPDYDDQGSPVTVTGYLRIEGKNKPV